ncbi:MAG: hypothetical protein H6741_28015 [Alphaproteobacteria bacterium]|nr:hypothetical protein [Alphaproteobacteria bacterium]MCB9796562.1 hypothetical protein [Alphaproteobacteria bacterium]
MGERRRIIEGRWTCSSCGTEGILGRHKTCTACGSPREQEEMKFNFGERDAESGKAKAATVSDAALVAGAKAGADWLCTHCEAGNAATDAACKKCGAPRGSERPPPPPEPEPEPDLEPEPRRRSGLGCLVPVFGLGLLGAGCMGLLLWLGQTHEVEGVVSGRSFTRTVTLQTFQPMRMNGWRAELEGKPATRMPKKGAGGSPGVDDLRDCEKKQKGTRKVPDGEEQVCRTKSRSVACGSHEECEVKDLGNGFAEEVCRDVTDYCDEDYEDCQMETRYREEPVYGQWCTYTTYTWADGAQKVTRGSGADALAWPSLEPQGDLQRAKREQSFVVHFGFEEDGEGETHVETREDEAWYQSWPVGAEAELDVDRLDNVSHIRHPGEEQSELTQTR